MNYELLEKVFYKQPNQYEEIYKSRISSESAYKLDIQVNNFPAFFVITTELLNLNTKIYQMSAKFSDLLNKNLISIANNKLYSHELPKNKFLIKCLINELIITNDIEGIITTRKDILDAIDANIKKDKKVRFQGIVNKYLLIIDDEKIDFMSCTKLRKLYDDIVLNELEEEDLPDGEIFRKNTVSVSDGIKPVHKGLYPEREIIEAMENAIAILRDEKIPMLFRIAIFHYLIGYIHPFYDGNGRLSRFISSYLLKEDVNVFVALKLSYAIKKNKKQYYKAFKITNDYKNRGDLTYFIYVFIEFIYDAMMSVYEDILYLFNKLISYMEIIYKSNFDNFDKAILSVLAQVNGFSDNELYISELKELTKINETTLRERLEKLIIDGYVEKGKDGKRNVYSLVVNKLDQLL